MIQNSKFKKIAARYSVLAAFMLFTLFGCGYTLQTRADLPFEQISIGRIENKTIEPKLQDRFSRILAETLLEYGFYLNPQAKYKIEGDVEHFELKPLSEKLLTVVEYQVVIKGKFRLVDAETGKVRYAGTDDPFVTYFIPKGKLEDVIANKELATEDAVKNLSQDLIRRIIYEH